MSEEQANQDPQETASQVPEYIPEKFRSAEDPNKALADAYSELEKKLHSTPPAKIEDKPKEAPTEEPNKADPIDLSKFDLEYAEKGELSEESYAELESRGFTRRDVEGIIQLRTEKAQVEAQKLYDSIEGGKESYDSAIQWAAENFSQDEKDDFNYALQRSPRLRDAAVQSLINDWKSSGSQPAKDPESTEGKPINNAAAASNVSSKYASTAEMRADMKSRKYKTDPEFREAVYAKAAASGFMQ